MFKMEKGEGTTGKANKVHKKLKRVGDSACKQRDWPSTGAWTTYPP